MNLKNLPIVQNLSVAPSNPNENQCYFNTNDKCYYIYAYNQWNIVNYEDTVSLYYYLRYTTTTNSNWTIETYSSMSDLENRISNLTNLKNIEIYYGSTTQPQNEFIINSNTIDDQDYMPTIERYQLINNIYVFVPVAQIYPKIIFNDNVIQDLNFNGSTVFTLSFTDNERGFPIWLKYPAFQLEIIEHSTPANINIGYTQGEIIQLEFKYTYQGTISNLRNVNLYSAANFTTPLNETFTINDLNTTGSFYRNYIVTVDDAFLKDAEKNFSCILQYVPSSLDYTIPKYQTECSITIPVAAGTRGYIVTYETVDGTTGSANYATYTDLFAAIPKDAAPYYKNLSITEGVYYASV